MERVSKREADRPETLNPDWRTNGNPASPLTEQGGGVLIEGGGDRRVHGGLAVSGRELRPGVVSALVVVVLDVEVDQLGEVDAQRAAGIVDVLTVQGLHSRRRALDHGSLNGLPRHFGKRDKERELIVSPRSLTSFACWAFTGSLNCSKA